MGIGKLMRLETHLWLYSFDYNGGAFSCGSNVLSIVTTC